LADIAGNMSYPGYCTRCYHSVVCLSVRLSVTLVHTGQNEMPFGTEVLLITSLTCVSSAIASTWPWPLAHNNDLDPCLGVGQISLAIPAG